MMGTEKKKLRNAKVRGNTRGRKPCVVWSNPQSRGGKNRRVERRGRNRKI